jgi:protein-S-isoprenylcysteine O-methyltransferase Ste14
MHDSSRSHSDPPQAAPAKGAGLPELGARGEGWVVAQFILLAAIALSALVGLGWTGSLEVLAIVAGVALMAVGGLLVVLGGVQLGSSLTPFPAPRVGGELSAGGVYALARHPMYGGGILIALGWSILFGSVVGFVLTLLLAIFFELKARREEAWLVDHYPGYASYRERTRRKLLPWLY